MLLSLAIRDIVLIETLDLEFGPADGLGVLTGETGAGKSILLDSLGLASGGRAERGLVREGARQGSVVALFDLPAGHPVFDLLDAQDIARDDVLVLRRVVGADGRSRAYVNDQPVGTGLLRRIGDLLVDIHGQHDARGLLDPAMHRELLDLYGGLESEVLAVRAAHAGWRSAADALVRLEGEVGQAQREELYWRQMHQELADLAPQGGEEVELADARARLMNREKLVEAVQESLEALQGGQGASGKLAGIERRLGRVEEMAADLLSPAREATERALVECQEAVDALERAARELVGPGRDLEQIEERLFALRAAARKYRIDVDGLPGLLAETSDRLSVLDAGAERTEAAAAAERAARASFEEAARVLSSGRMAAAADLSRAVVGELPPLKLERARIEVALEPLPEDEWGPDGAERVRLMAAMNPGQTPASLAKVASGGELSRLMLALKVVLAGTGNATTIMVFDEIDAGVGGATADAVGERLARLAADRQVLVVTHAPQIAARADQHWRVSKAVEGERTRVTVEPLDDGAERREEVARMLAGAEVTAEARAAADSLIRRSA
ncbi:DNA repair protein RecN [Marinivivus vitaminiproducens]|uniref:DNA repair protein RecN n=1 Tax=Marinivivus vitaminiproducens TaxID=3035935 RepID=UPI0027A61337|nr:DNA repair protein RecN [Geminicoccaceae bacterium SCSIO 64248]